MFDAFVDLKPVERVENRKDTNEFRSLNKKRKQESFESVGAN